MIQLQKHGKPFPQQELSPSQQPGHGRAESALRQDEKLFSGQCKYLSSVIPRV